MNDNPLYSADQIAQTYEKINGHKLTKKIISSYSTNPEDVRELALSNLALEEVNEVLDLGCGYGLFEEKLKGRLSIGATITGVDIVSSNEAPFLKTVRDAGYAGKFINSSADIISTFKTGMYDLVIASYSLYFFPGIIKDIARVLKSGGMFITITHSRESLKEVTEIIPDSIVGKGLNPPDELAIRKLLNAFSMEEGYEQLKPYFSDIEVIMYSNAMLFSPDNIPDCIEYLVKKRPLLFKEVIEMHPEKASEVENHFYDSLKEMVIRDGGLSITKDDAVFRAYTPKNSNEKA